MFEDGELRECGQIEFVTDRKGSNEGVIQWPLIDELIYRVSPDKVVMEDYRVYQHKLDRHSYSPVLTLRIIGALEFICCMEDIPLYSQMAATAKGFATDKKLKDWGFFEKAQRHSRDSIRHAIYFMLFNKEAK